MKLTIVPILRSKSDLTFFHLLSFHELSAFWVPFLNRNGRLSGIQLWASFCVLCDSERGNEVLNIRFGGFYLFQGYNDIHVSVCFPRKFAHDSLKGTTYDSFVDFTKCMDVMIEYLSKLMTIRYSRKNCSNFIQQRANYRD